MALFGDLFGGYENPADAAQPYLNQIPGRTQQYYQPYFDTGTKALNQVYDEYGNLINNPGGKYNEIGGQFQQSPGFNFAVQQALQGSNHAAAAGGMAGSPQHEQQNMQLATDLANQDYYKYMQGATGLYGQGLQGLQSVSQQGQTAGNNLANMIAQTLAQQAQLAYTGQQNENQHGSSLWNNIGQGVGALAAFL